MKKHLTVLFILFVVLAKGQDTLVVNKDTVLCKITRVTSMNIFYTEKKIGKSIAIKDVSYYSNPSVVAPVAKVEAPKEPQIKDVKVSDELFYIRENLRRCHKQYITGVVLTSSGYAIALIGGATLSWPVILVGGVIGTVGHVVTVDSHKWIKRASFGIGGNGAKVTYTF